MPGREVKTNQEKIFEISRNVIEIPSRNGIALAGFYLFMYIGLLILLFFTSQILTIPKYDFIVDARLSDNYIYQFSEPFPNSLNMPELQKKLTQPIVSDMAQDDEHVFLSTFGHGIQSYNKNNFLWKTYDANSTNVAVKNDIKEVHYQKAYNDNRLWTLNFEGGISLGKINGDKINFDSIFASDSWKYFTREEITTTLMFDKHFVAFGTASKGAAIYDTDNHSWYDLPKIRDKRVKKIIYNDNLLWFLTDQGVNVYQKHKVSDIKNTFKHIQKYQLKQPNLNNLKAFERDCAIVLTEDGGCFLFKKRWSNKLLGGIAIPNLTQDNIRYSTYWKNMLVVCGESFGVVAYIPEQRSWKVLYNGPMENFTDFQYNNNLLVIATINGVVLISEKQTIRLLEGNYVRKIALSNKGILYSISKDNSSIQEICWSDIYGLNQKVLFSSDRLPIENQLIINDVLFNDGSFLLATDENGVIKYTLNGRRLEQINRTESGQIYNAKKFGISKNDIFMLSDYTLYKQNKQTTSTDWIKFRKDVKNFHLDTETHDLWVQNKNESITHFKGDENSEEIWFAGKGPKTLDLSSTKGIISSSSPGKFRAYFPDTIKNEMNVYDSQRGIWQPPFKIPHHEFEMFEIHDAGLFTLGNDNRIYLDKQILIGDGNSANFLNHVMSIKQKEENGKITVYGQRAKSDYEPRIGKWVHGPDYSFLHKNENISAVFSSELNYDGKEIAKTSLNRVLLIDKKWDKATEVGTYINSDQFAGKTFWNLYDGKLIGQTITESEKNITLSRLEYFSGSAPDLSETLETWLSESKNLNIISPSYWHVYNLETHSWDNYPLPNGKTLKADYNGNELQIINENKIYYLSSPGKIKHSLTIPSGKFKKLNSYDGNKVITINGSSNKTNKTFYYTEKDWKQLLCDRSRLKGKFSNISKIFNHNSALWVSQSGNFISRYKDGSWKNIKIPDGFKLVSFWNGPDNHLFLVGYLKEYKIALPFYFYNNGRIDPLPGIPQIIKDTRLENDRYLWVKGNSNDTIIFDLNNPQQKGLNLNRVYENMQSKIAYQFLFNFSDKTFTILPLQERIDAVKKILRQSEIKETHLQRDGSTLKVYMKTKADIFIFENIDGQWFYSESYTMNRNNSLTKTIINSISDFEPVDPANFNIEKADFRIALSSMEKSLISMFLNRGAHPGQISQIKSAALKFNNLPETEVVKVDNVIVKLQKDGIHGFIETSGRTYPLPFRNGCFEIDDAIIDATINSTGQWVALRKNSLAFYEDRTFKKLINYGKFDSIISKSAFIETMGNELILNTPDAAFSISLSNGMIHLTPYKRNNNQTIYANSVTGFEVVKKGVDINILINGVSFTGREKFPFDNIKKIAASKSNIYLMTEGAVWKFYTSSGNLDKSEFYKIPKHIGKNKTFSLCFSKGIYLNDGNYLYHIDKSFSRVSNNECPKMIKVADELGWQWYFHQDGIIYFKANKDGKWTKAIRQKSGEQFLDDKFEWLTFFNGHLYAAQGLGITMFSKNGKEDIYYSGEKIVEIKEFNRFLYAKSESSKIYVLSKTNKWKICNDTSLSSIFNRYTQVYSDPFIIVEKFKNSLRFKTIEGDILDWDKSKRKFISDIARDFVVINDTLFIVNSQNNKIVSFNYSGQRTGFHLKDKIISGFEEHENNFIALSDKDKYIFNRKTTKWEKSDISQIVIAQKAGILFNKHLNIPEKKINPVLSGREVKNFWNNGKFTFDQIETFAAGNNNWWAMTKSGLINVNNGYDAHLIKFYPEIINASRMKIINTEIFLQIGSQMLALDENSGKLSNTNIPIFTKTVFDYSFDRNKGFKWIMKEVRDTDPRQTFLLNTSWREKITDVFYHNRFFWDQVYSAAYEMDKGLYWFVTPQNLAVNRYDIQKGGNFQLVLFQIPDVGIEQYPKHSLVDAVFANNTLNILFVDFKNKSEINRKWNLSKWQSIEKNDYAFWHWGTVYNIKENTWKPFKMTYSEYAYAKGNDMFRFEGPDDYPVFAELDYPKGFGRFSFDYIKSIHPIDNTVWAGTKGGLIKLRYLYSKDTKRLEIEKIFLTDDGLNNLSILKLKEQNQKGLLGLLTRNKSEKESAQQIQIPLWTHEEKYKKETQKTLFIRNPQNKIKYILSYYPVLDEYIFSIKLSKKDKINLFQCLPIQNEKTLKVRTEHQKYIININKKDISFDIKPSNNTQTFSKLSFADFNNPRPFLINFNEEFSYDNKLSWGHLKNGKPAFRSTDGKIYEIINLIDINNLYVNQKGLSWNIYSKNGMLSYFYNELNDRIEEIKETQEGYEWINHVPPAGTGISHYLHENDIIDEEKGTYSGIITNVESEWIKLIVKRNKIPLTTIGNKTDYHLLLGKTYLFPKKRVKIINTIRKQKTPLVIGKRNYDLKNRLDKTNKILNTERGLIAYTKNQFLEFNLDRKKVFYSSFPCDLQPHNLWEENGDLMMSFVKKGDTEEKIETDVWKYLPFSMTPKRTEEITPQDIKQIKIINSNRRLMADEHTGFVVDTGRKRKKIEKSSEWVFDTKINKVVKFSNDSSRKGYWIATDTSGLIWSKYPF
ncbi:MAG: hypothetical protein ABIK92_06630 [Pseudomonadota bacterium]